MHIVGCKKRKLVWSRFTQTHDRRITGQDEVAHSLIKESTNLELKVLIHYLIMVVCFLN